MNPHTLCKMLLLVTLPGIPLAGTFAATDTAAAFRDAYYLEIHDQDFAAAVAAYEKIVADAEAAPELAAEARTHLAACREDLRAADLAQLMPPRTVLYAELQRPGDHLENLVKMLGLTGASAAAPAGYAIPGEPDLFIPRQITISPALLAEAKAFRGVALAVTDLDARGEKPDGVLVLHPGNVDWIRGAIETMAQFVRPAEPIAGFSTITIEAPEMNLTACFTHRLIVVGTQRALVEGVLERLENAAADSLADNALFVEQAARREPAMFFAFVNAQEGVQRLQRMASQRKDMLRDLAMAQGLFDLAHLDALSLAVGATPDDLRAEFVMSLREGQTNLVYNLLRSPPMQGRALALTPAGAAAVLAIGINPDSSAAQGQQINTKSQTVQAITGLDVGRELFANIRELAVFVLPPAASAPMRQEIPDAGLVLVVGDPDKSEALWTYLLSLPSRVQGRTDLAPETTTVNGVEVQAFHMDRHVTVHFARVEGNILIGTSPRVLSETIAALGDELSVRSDPALQPALGRLSEETSVALIAHVGRLVALAGSMASEQEAGLLGLIADAAPSTLLTIQAEESPTRLRLSGGVTGLPQVADILAVLAQAGILTDHRSTPPPTRPATPAAPVMSAAPATSPPH